MGGIEVNLNSKVKGFKNLYAIGEVANTGVHGANRLASNSLLECFVFAKRASLDVNFKTKYKEFAINDEILIKEGDKEFKNKLRELMWKNVGIIRTEKSLIDTLRFIEDSIERVGRITKLRFLTAREIVKASIDRKKSLGAHFRKD